MLNITLELRATQLLSSRIRGLPYKDERNFVTTRLFDACLRKND